MPEIRGLLRTRFFRRVFSGHPHKIRTSLIEDGCLLFAKGTIYGAFSPVAKIVTMAMFTLRERGGIMDRTRTLLIAAGAFGLGLVSGWMPAVRAQAPAAAAVRVTIIHRDHFEDQKHPKDPTAVPGEVIGFSCPAGSLQVAAECYVLSR